MKQRSGLFLFTLISGMLLSSAVQADAKRGEELHNQQCIACHASRFGNNGADIYTRENRRVNDLAGLQRQVNRCKDNLRITWFDEEVNHVVDYLNATYYKFQE